MIVWQLAILATIILAAYTVYDKHQKGDRHEAANLATSAAVTVGIAMMVTGFIWGPSGDPESENNSTPVTAALPNPQPIQEVPAPAILKPQAEPQTQPSFAQAPMGEEITPAQAQTAIQMQIPVPMQPANPQINLGQAGASFDRVHAIITKYQGIYQQAGNDIQRTELRFARGRELCQNQSGIYAAVMRLDSLSTTKTGEASVSFSTPSGMEFIPNSKFARGSPIHTALAPLSIGSNLVVFFTFESDQTGKDCFHSNRWTERNNMTKPRWDINLSEIQILR